MGIETAASDPLDSSAGNDLHALRSYALVKRCRVRSTSTTHWRSLLSSRYQR